MSAIRRFMMLAVFLFYLVGGVALTADEDTIEVVATGIGQDSDRALRNALRAAIEQAVGTLVDSQTIAENDEVINDQILSYSGGFVESHKVIGEPKTVDGLVSVKIVAQVKRTELTEKLEAAAVHVSDVDGESLFGEAITKIERNQASGDIVKPLFDGFPANVMDIRRVDKPEYDERTKKWKIKVEISVNRDKYRSFVQKIIPVLKTVAQKSQRITKKTNMDERNEFLDIIEIEQSLYRENAFVVCTQMNDAKTNSIWEAFWVPEEALSAASAIKTSTFTVDIVDNQNDVIVSETFSAPAPYGYFKNHLGTSSQEHACFIFPVLSKTIWIDPNRPVSLVIRPGDTTVIYDISFDISPNEFKRMKNVVCKING